MESALTFLQRYHDDGDEFLDQVITGNETGVAHITPETKHQWMHWRNRGSPCKMKFNQILSVQKVKCMVFCNRQDILLIDFLTRSETVNAEHYCRNCNRPFRTSGTGCLLPMLSCCTIILSHTRLDCQHNSCKNSAGKCLITHPIAQPHTQWFPSFLHFNKFLSGQCFQNDRGGDKCHTVVPIPGGRFLWHRDAKVGPTVWQMSQFQRQICWKKLNTCCICSNKPFH